MTTQREERGTDVHVRGVRAARFLRLIAIVLLAWSVIVMLLAWVLASGRSLEAIHPLKYRQHWDIVVCFEQALVVLAGAAVASLISFVIRPSWWSVALLLVSLIAWGVLFEVLLHLIT